MRKNIFPTHIKGSFLTIDLGAIASNYALLKSQFSGASMGAVIKADAYGLGAQDVAPALYQKGCRDFWVATLDEGLRLRSILPNSDAHIYILNGVPAHAEGYCTEANLIPVVNSLSDLARFKNQKIPIVIHLDTGLNRLGLEDQETQKLIHSAELLKGLDIRYWMSHLACSDDIDHLMNEKQRQIFTGYLSKLPPAPASLAASDGLFLGRQFHFDHGRPGCALYGVNPSPWQKNPMQPVAHVYAPILQIRTAHKGETVGYAASHSVRRDQKIAVLALGYADGYFRSLSNCGIVYIGEQSAPVVGRISMDLITVDISDLTDQDIAVGTYAQIIGNHIDVDQVAKAAGTIGYEVLTNLGHRFARHVVSES